ncbi:MAG: metallophosphoesterase [Cyanosarcina radialis HA8281-LM2]|nr:metallophosphoesterase [Cyanosarcina radialis HA8281-LM2]
MSGKSTDILFAVVGDIHGHIRYTIELLKKWESIVKDRFDFVLQVGDFEPNRNEADLLTMAAPKKYKKLGDFPDFYNKKAAFPWPIYFIGGNHEPYGFLDRMPNGAKIAENCYYLGRVGSKVIETIKIAGLSGIYQESKFRISRPSIENISILSNKEYIYFNEEDILQLLDYKKVDILLLHEWPANIINCNEIQSFKEITCDSNFSEVGNEYARISIDLLAPKLVLCGHMHYKYQTKIVTGDGTNTAIYCLANVSQGDDAIAIFRATSDGNFRNIID